MLEVERNIIDMAHHLQATLEEWEPTRRANSALRGRVQIRARRGRVGGGARVGEILRKGRQKAGGHALVQVSYVHAHFKDKVDEDAAAEEPRAGRKRSYRRSSTCGRPSKWRS